MCSWTPKQIPSEKVWSAKKFEFVGHTVSLKSLLVRIENNHLIKTFANLIIFSQQKILFYIKIF